MAFGTPVHLVSAQNKTSANQLTLAMGGASVAGGSVFMILVVLAFDNISTAAGDNGDVTSMSDSGGNTYVKVGEMTNAGNAGTAVTTSIWIADAVTELTTSNAINVNFSGNTTAKAASAFKVPKSATATLQVGATNTSSADSAATGQSLSVTPPDNREWFFVRADGCEQTSSNGSAWGSSNTAGWDGGLDGTSTSGGGAASNILFMAEYDISTTGSARTSNPGDGNLPSCDWAAVIGCVREVESTPSVGRANETDSAFNRGAALGVNRANETDTASAIFPKVVLATQRPIETDSAFNRSITHGVNRANETDTAFALTQGIIQLPVGQANETDTAFKAGGIAMAPNRPIETDTASARSVVLQVRQANEADTAFACQPLGGVGLAVETDTAFALSQVIILPVGRVHAANSSFDSNYLGEWVTFDASISVVAGRLRVTANNTASVMATVVFPSVGAALGVGNVVRVQGEGFAGTANAVVRLDNGTLGAPGQPFTNTAFDVLHVLTGTSVKINATLNDLGAVSIGEFAEFDNFIVTTWPREVDTAFALNRLDTPAWTRSNETDSAFALTTGFPVVTSIETDSAFSRSAIFIRGVAQALETDSAFSLNRLETRAVGRADEVSVALNPGLGWAIGRGTEADTAFACTALQIYPTGFAQETDTAFQMFGALTAGSGRKPHTKGNESILRDRRQPVHKTI